MTSPERPVRSSYFTLSNRSLQFMILIYDRSCLLSRGTTKDSIAGPGVTPVAQCLHAHILIESKECKLPTYNIRIKSSHNHRLFPILQDLRQGRNLVSSNCQRFRTHIGLHRTEYWRYQDISPKTAPIGPSKNIHFARETKVQTAPRDTGSSLTTEQRKVSRREIINQIYLPR